MSCVCVTIDFDERLIIPEALISCPNDAILNFHEIWTQVYKLKGGYCGNGAIVKTNGDDYSRGRTMTACFSSEFARLTWYTLLGLFCKLLLLLTPQIT